MSKLLVGATILKSSISLAILKGAFCQRGECEEVLELCKLEKFKWRLIYAKIANGHFLAVVANNEQVHSPKGHWKSPRV